MPAILEASPYRLTDGGQRDWDIYPYWAGCGYACARVDLRGTGDSEGVILDEYTAQEQRDVCEVIAWLAAQPWCSGNVGMTGISWAGFNSLQVAALRPPALKAIITSDVDRRPLRRRRALQGRLRLGPRHAGLGRHHAALQRAAAAPAGGRRSGLARALAASAWAPTATGPRPGSPTSAATPTGSTARSARTTARSRPPSTRSAAGPTATQRGPAPARRPARAAQGPDRPLVALLSRTTSCRGRRSASCRRRCAGGTTGSRASTPASWTSPCCASGWRTTSRRRRSSPSIPGAGWPRTSGRRRASSRAPGRSMRHG